MTGVVNFYREREPYVLGGGFIVLFLVAWESIPLWVSLPRSVGLFFTTPSQVTMKFYELMAAGTIQEHFYVSAWEFVVGLGLSIAVGLPFGLIMGRSRTLEALLDPYVTALNATPRLIWLPLLIIWVGIGIWSKIIIVFLGAVFPLLINTYTGVKNVDRVLINMVRSFGAREWHVMKIVVLPYSVPYIVVGLRLAVGRAVLGVVVGEFFAATKGLGAMIARAATAYQVDVVFVGVAIFMGISLIFTFTIKKIETNLTRWRPEQVKTF
jgi:ABC-type nitrate/sulfonate/bicarbonate transport system permease component